MAIGDMTSPTGNSPGTQIDLPERLDFTACGALFDAICNQRGRPLLLQAGNVEFLGALAAEILIRAKAEWQTDGLGFELINPSKGLVQGLSLLGIPQDTLIQEDLK
ncbi:MULTISPECIES: STAS domain-containing protein [Sediminimonas]|uniref:STAS domain-containing protein n=1 Tax=Sediminimonas TaxID=659427 RepID=UPI00055E1778|nr:MULTISPECIES: STAS domain-containing protein [Sediminimonas]MDR9485210.1 STAS domain-containing protein [Sediminimonas sp.]